MAETAQANPARSAAEQRAALRPPSLASQIRIVLEKDLLIELRTGEVVITSGFFAFLVVVMASLAFYGGFATSRAVAAGAIWISVAFAAVLGLGKTWQRERDEAALDGLLVSPLARSAIFAGKALGVFLFLTAVEAVVIPSAMVLFAVDPIEYGPGLCLIALAATPGIAASGTLFGAMTVRTQARDLLLAIVLFPLLSPTLLAAVVATKDLLDGRSIAELVDYFKLLVAFDVAFIAGGLGLFGTLIER